MPLVINGWRVMAHPLLIGQVLKLAAAVQEARRKDPDAAAVSANGKLLAALVQLLFHDIPADPTDSRYRQGDTLGKARKHWFRAKFGNGRFRLFFRYSQAHRIIVFAWVNDAQSLRTYGARNDAYRVFRGMLDDGQPPDHWEALLAECGPEADLAILQARLAAVLAP